MNRRSFLKSVAALVASGLAPAPLLAAIERSVQKSFVGTQEFWWEEHSSDRRGDSITRLGYSHFDGSAWEHVTADYFHGQSLPSVQTWMGVARRVVKNRRALR